MLRKLFNGKPKKKEPEELIPVPVPALAAVLLNQENEKVSPLTEQEVLEIRDNAICIMIPISVVNEIAAYRGYDDLIPEYIWEQWQQTKLELIKNKHT